MKIFKKKEEKSTELVKEFDKTVDAVKEENEEKLIEWIWVDGYKGMNKNMMCLGHQFEIGNKYIHDGDIKECESGFHLCLKLEDVLNYYRFDFKNRYFRVRALVKKNDYEQYGKFEVTPFCYNKHDKLTSKEIQIVSELTEEEYYEICNNSTDKFEKISVSLSYVNTRQVSWEYKYIKSIADYRECRDFGSYIEYKKKYFITELMKTKVYSDTFSIWFVNKRKIDDDMFEKAIALASENLSHDMRIVLLLT